MQSYTVPMRMVDHQYIVILTLLLFLKILGKIISKKCVIFLLKDLNLILQSNLYAIGLNDFNKREKGDFISEIFEKGIIIEHKFE